MSHIYDRDVPVTMRDGVTLRANVWRPSEGTAPTLVVRMPYNKDSADMFGGTVSPMPALLSMVNAGYAVVYQDVRGTFASDGVFAPKVNEMADGEDFIAWLTEQPWFDGSVAAYGGSYLGMTQYALALGDNPALKAIAPTDAAADWYHGLWYSRGGALSLSLVTAWSGMMMANAEQRELTRGEQSDPTRLMTIGGAMTDILSLNDATPVLSRPVLGTGRWLDEWLTHPTFDSYWKAQDWSSRLNEITVPVLETGGWYDVKLHQQIRDFVTLRTEGGSEATREQSRLVIGPWDHVNTSGQFPDRSFGIFAVQDQAPLHAAFFDEHVKGITAETPAPRVRIFVMGIDQWRDEADWPLPDTNYTDYHLSSAGSANTRNGDGVLTTETPVEERTDQFRYDPKNPVPTAGGALLPPLPGLVGPVDQSSIDSRDDILCYTGPVLSEAVEVTGPVELKVAVSATTVDTDITAKLVDVYPDGTAINLCDGILRLRYRDSLSEPTLMTPGDVYEVTVPMSVTSNVFLPGHRIRLDVSGSNFPHYDRNSNTGGEISTEALEDMIPSDITVHHGGTRPSRLVLPIINR
ncbi:MULTISPECIES: CocE/NonD family hydrolase [unclassified Curtobacterium]|uniref:CocE/NonD family hydrolase n=1 Tax=unclassified Curtobacterium TaxID=257496 RepID=UPI003A80AD7D